MTFYIPPFWCGVIVTVIIWFVAILVIGIVQTAKEKTGKDKRGL